MEFNTNHRENPLKKFTPEKPKVYKQVKNTLEKKLWWEINEENNMKKLSENIKKVTDKTDVLVKKELSLAERVLLEEKLEKMKENSCIDKAIEDYNVDFSVNGKIMLKYMEKYLNNDKPLFKKIQELEKSDIKNEFCEYEWALIIEQAWIISYKKAMDDEYITLEERHELNNLYSLAKKYKNSLFYQPQMKQKIKDNFKVLAAIDNKYAIENRYEDSELWMKQYDSVPKQTKYYKRLPNPRPKLTPYSDGQYGYR